MEKWELKRKHKKYYPQEFESYIYTHFIQIKKKTQISPLPQEKDTKSIPTLIPEGH